MIVECTGCHLRYDFTGRPPGTKARCRCGRELTLPEPAGEAASLACPKCGAACRPSETRCEYCGSALATARCPRCFGLLFRGAQHCSHCGTRVDEPARAAEEGEKSPRQCPRCGRGGSADLVARAVAETLLDECQTCGGLWIDQVAFERITKESQSQQSALRALGALPPPRGELTEQARKVVYLRCPDCDTVMHRRNYARRSGIIIDVCAAHGIWFDRDELTHVIEFVRRGGLEESKRRDLEDLRREAAKAETARLSATQRSGFFGNEGLFAEADSSPLMRLFRVLSQVIE